MQGHFAEGHLGNSLIRAPHGVLNLALASVVARHAILNQSQYDLSRVNQVDVWRQSG